MKYKIVKQNQKAIMIKAAKDTPTGSSRQEKSLGENCKKFLQLFGAKQCLFEKEWDLVNVDDCIKQLGIGRRRIYDIINILESFKMIRRLKKNEYAIKPATFIKDMIQEIEVSVQTNFLILLNYCRTHMEIVQLNRRNHSSKSARRIRMRARSRSRPRSISL